MKKGYQGDEIWSAVNPASGKRELIDPEGEFIPGETIVKLYYRNRLDGYVTRGHRCSKSQRIASRSNL
jgi:hypothetical protein